jgi:hypothetical protein
MTSTPCSQSAWTGSNFATDTGSTLFRLKEGGLHRLRCAASRLACIFRLVASRSPSRSHLDLEMEIQMDLSFPEKLPGTGKGTRRLRRRSC